MEGRKKDSDEIRLVGWHLRKEITLGQIFTILCLTVSGIWWASSVETRFVQVNAEIRRVEQKNEIQNKAIMRILGRIERKLDKMND